MTDFQLAMAVMGLLVAILGAAVVGRRRPERASASASTGTPAERIDLIGIEVAEIKANQAEIKSRQAETDHNVAQIRTMMSALPSKDAVHRIEVELSELKGDVKLNNSQATATAKGVERIENWLMQAEEAKRLLALEEARRQRTVS